MSDPELPKLPEPQELYLPTHIMRVYPAEDMKGILLSFAREAMEIGRKAGLEEAARIARDQAEALAENLYGHPREKAVEWAKEDKFDSQVAVANELLSIVADAICSAVSNPADSGKSN